MRSIPAALKEKLLNRFKSSDTDSEPNMRIVATQISINTLLTEPIHEEIRYAVGDVAIRQTEEDETPALAYAICLDNGTAKLYLRNFPTEIEYKWEYLWTFGTAQDVAIEYNGSWQMDVGYKWYYLQTEKYPYIFTVESGKLYVQHWDDVSTRTLLAENVSQISSCKGWQNSIDKSMDQGMIIGYIKSGMVYYRTYCCQSEGNYAWESEKKVEELGNGNTTLSVIRTNDFRVGFLTENRGNIMLALSTRCYAGMSVRPESLHIHCKAAFYYKDIVEKRGQDDRNTLIADLDYSYFNFDVKEGSPEIAIKSVERLNRDEDFMCYGLKIYFDKEVHGTTNNKLAVETTLNSGSKRVTTISSSEFSEEEQALYLLFAEDVRRTVELTVKTPEIRPLWYKRVQDEKWFVPALNFVVPADVNTINGFEPEEILEYKMTAKFKYQEAAFHDGYHSDTIKGTTEATFVLQPVSALPI